MRTHDRSIRMRSGWRSAAMGAALVGVLAAPWADEDPEEEQTRQHDRRDGGDVHPGRHPLAVVDSTLA